MATLSTFELANCVVVMLLAYGLRGRGVLSSYFDPVRINSIHVAEGKIMADAERSPEGRKLADEIARRRGTRYPAHAYIAEKFPDYMEVLLDLDEVIRAKPRKFDEKMHELFHILALAVEMSNPPNQPHLRQHIKKGLKLGLEPEAIAEALMVCVNPCGTKVLTYGVTCMLEAMAEIEAEAAGQSG